jgi:hypothetical protein
MGFVTAQPRPKPGEEKVVGIETSLEFIDILRRQRDDATAQADAARAKLYTELVRVIEARTG